MLSAFGIRHFAFLLLGGLILAASALSGCRDSSKPGAPAGGGKTPSESDAAFVMLSAKKHSSLGIESQPAVTGPVQRHLPLTGWVLARPGHEVTLTAPVGGYVRISAKLKRSPQQGEAVAENQELFDLEPVLSPVEQVQMATLQRGVDSEVSKAKESLHAARQERDRVKMLYDQKLRGDQEMEQVQLKFRHAEEDLKSAQDKLKLFTLSRRVLDAPWAGTIITVHVSPDQYVAAAAPLITIVDLREVWLRVPVPESDLAQVNGRAPVTVALKGNGNAGHGGWSGRFVARPAARVPRVDPALHTADFFYALSPYSLEEFGKLAAQSAAMRGAASPIPWLPQPTAFAKDQMLTVFVPVGETSSDPPPNETVVPYSAIIFDAFGGSCIYLDRTGPKERDHKFERRRVDLGPSVEGGIVIRPPLASGDRVVTTGAAVLFSCQFHTPAGKKQEVDDDD